MARGARTRVLLTGPPGIGKTTVIRRFLERSKREAGGFYTGEIRRGGQRFGFSLNLLDGRQLVLASVEIESPWRVGKYGVDLATFEAAAIPEIERAVVGGRLVVVDEIGKMELFSRRFREAVRLALDSAVPVLGTLLSRPNAFADEIRQREDVKIIEVTLANRDRLPDDLGTMFC